MRQIAFYGKGGIGKSTVVANVAASLAGAGKQVLQVGCDPKRDSTRMLLGGTFNPPVLDQLRTAPGELSQESVVGVGFNGVRCIEAGGPEPGVGCAGRGIIATFQVMERLRLYDADTDFILYDVLGDVVCGGFAVPIRDGYADEVYLVTSGELMSLYAANNIAKGIVQFSDRQGAKLAGVIGNARNVPHEAECISAFATQLGTEMIGFIPRCPLVQRAEIRGHTVMEFAPESDQARAYQELARAIETNTQRVTPSPLDIGMLERLALSWETEEEIP